MYTIDYDTDIIKNDLTGIEYWKKRLSQGNNYVMSMEDDLIDAFDYPLPRISSLSYFPDHEDFEALTHIVNKWKFTQLSIDIDVRHCSIDDMLFDLQSAVLDVGICEKGISCLHCSSSIACILAKEGNVVHISKCMFFFNKDSYKNIKFSTALKDVEGMLAFANIMQHNAISAFTSIDDTHIDEALNASSSSFGNTNFIVVDMLDDNRAKTVVGKDIAIMKHDNYDKLLVVKLY